MLCGMITIKNKELGLKTLQGQKAMIETQIKQGDYSKESFLLEKARRLFGAKLGEVVSEFMNVETYKKNGEILKGIEQDIGIVEKDINEFKAILGEK